MWGILPVCTVSSELQPIRSSYDKNLPLVDNFQIMDIAVNPEFMTRHERGQVSLHLHLLQNLGLLRSFNRRNQGRGYLGLNLDNINSLPIHSRADPLTEKDAALPGHPLQRAVAEAIPVVDGEHNVVHLLIGGVVHLKLELPILLH